MPNEATPVAPNLLGLPDRYQVLRRLGRGSQKEVFLADDTMLCRPVAVAAIDPSLLPNVRGARLHEARAMAQVGDHPHVVTVYDIIECPSRVYVITQYLPGGDLETFLQEREGELPIRLGLRFATHVARGLAVAHAQGIWHRDIKSGNVFLDDRGTAYLGDFGLAAQNRVDGDPFAAEVVGSLGYMAPELLRGTAAGPASDLYAFGCLLYELMTGALPFTGRGADLLREHRDLAPPDPRSRRPEIPNVLSRLMQCLLEKVPANRPASAADVRTSLEAILQTGTLPEPPRIGPLPNGREPDGIAGSHRLGDLPLVQRRTELATIRQILGMGRQGHPALVLLSGDAGVGKSRLLREVRAHAERAGFATLHGRGYEDLSLPFRPLVEALLPLTARLAELPAGDQDRMRRFLHAGEQGSADPEVPAAADDGHPLFLGVQRALAELATSQPIAMVIDDLQWADSATIDLFEHLVFSLAQAGTSPMTPIVLIVGIRSGDLPPRVSRALARFHREPLTVRMPLTGLDEVGVFELLQVHGWQRPSTQVARAVTDATGGNPLFVRELLAGLKTPGAAETDYSAISLASVRLPATVTEAVTARVDAQPPECRRLLSHAALLGRRFSLEDLGRFAGVSPADAGARLDPALAAKLVDDDGEAFEFTHEIVRQVCYDHWRPTQRRQLHLQLAHQLQLQAPSNDGRVEYAVAWHLIRAGSLAGAVEVAEATRRASRHALERFAWFEAAQLLEAAIAAHVQLSRAPISELAELHRVAGISYYRCSDVGPCLQHLDAAVELYQTTGDPLSLAGSLTDRARARFELGLLVPGESGEIALLNATLAALPEHELRTRATLLGTLASSYSLAHEPAVARPLAQLATALAEKTGDHKLCAALAIDEGLVAFNTMRLAEAEASYTTGMQRAHSAHDAMTENRCRSRLPIIQFLTGRLDDAQRTALEARARNRSLRQPEAELFGLATLASVALVRGAYSTAENHCHEAIGLLRRGRYPWAACILSPVLAAACVARDDLTGAYEATNLLLEPGLVFEDPAPLTVFVDAQRRFVALLAGVDPGGDPPDPPPLILGDQGFDPMYLCAVCGQVEIHAARSQQALDPDIQKALAIATGGPIQFTIGWPYLVPRILGIAAAVGQRWDEADGLFTRTAEVAAAVGAEPDLARTYIDHATMLLARPGAPDRARIANLLAAAEPLEAAAGGRWYRQRAAALRNQMGR